MVTIEVFNQIDQDAEPLTIFSDLRVDQVLDHLDDIISASRKHCGTYSLGIDISNDPDNQRLVVDAGFEVNKLVNNAAYAVIMRPDEPTVYAVSRSSDQLANIIKSLLGTDNPSGVNVRVYDNVTLMVLGSGNN